MFTLCTELVHDCIISAECSADVQPVLGSIVVSISACHAEDPGSIPGRGGYFLHFLLFFSCKIDPHFSEPTVRCIVTPCACAAGGRVIGLSVSLSMAMSVCPSKRPSLSSEGLVEGLFQDRSV